MLAYTQMHPSRRYSYTPAPPVTEFLMRSLFVLFWLAIGVYAHPANAQQTPRFGLGLNTQLALPDGLGIGAHGRVSAPVNADLSIMLDLAGTGFIFQGRKNATYILTPQMGVVVNINQQRYRDPIYLIAGFGGYLPVNSPRSDQGGPTFHVGIGSVLSLQETSLYYEVNPALIVAEDKVGISLPFRMGIIF